MLHRCTEGEKVGVDGSKVVDVDRRHDPCPGGTLAPARERVGEPPSSFFFLGLPLDGRRVPALVHGLHGGGGAGAPLRLDLRLCSLLFRVPRSGQKPFLIFPEIRNTDCAEILTRFLLDISFLASEVEPQLTYELRRRH